MLPTGDTTSRFTDLVYPPYYMCTQSVKYLYLAIIQADDATDTCKAPARTSLAHFNATVPDMTLLEQQGCGAICTSLANRGTCPTPRSGSRTPGRFLTALTGRGCSQRCRLTSRSFRNTPLGTTIMSCLGSGKNVGTPDGCDVRTSRLHSRLSPRPVE
jgi:hypothetical protein